MNPLPKKCEDINSVRSFCDCMGGEGTMDPAAQAFCQRIEGGGATGDELIELKKALKDIEGAEPEESDSEGDCCEC